MYVFDKDKHTFNYPKLISGTFLSRVSFADMFENLPNNVKEAVKATGLLQMVAKNIRGTYSDDTMLFPQGYFNKDRSGVEKGPTLQQWINGFTRLVHTPCVSLNSTSSDSREEHPVDLLAELDYDKSMGRMSMDATLCGDKGIQTHWIIENRNVPKFSSDVVGAFETLFQFLSTFNLRPVV
jgi:hypothetical protein